MVVLQFHCMSYCSWKLQHVTASHPPDPTIHKSLILRLHNPRHFPFPPLCYSCLNLRPQEGRGWGKVHVHTPLFWGGREVVSFIRPTLAPHHFLCNFSLDPCIPPPPHSIPFPSSLNWKKSIPEQNT